MQNDRRLFCSLVENVVSILKEMNANVFMDNEILKLKKIHFIKAQF